MKIHDDTHLWRCKSDPCTCGAKIVAHDPDCPALCGHGPQGMNTCGHLCTCTAQTDLAELVNKAKTVLSNSEKNRVAGGGSLTITEHDANALRAALNPFREEKPDARFPCEPRSE